MNTNVLQLQKLLYSLQKLYNFMNSQYLLGTYNVPGIIIGNFKYVYAFNPHLTRIVTGQLPKITHGMCQLVLNSGSVLLLRVALKYENIQCSKTLFSQWSIQRGLFLLPSQTAINHFRGFLKFSGHIRQRTSKDLKFKPKKLLITSNLSKQVRIIL